MFNLQRFIHILIGEYQSSGRDSLVFLVDASKEMFVKGEDGEPSNFDMTMQVCTDIPPEIQTVRLLSKSMVRDRFNRGP